MDVNIFVIVWFIKTLGQPNFGVDSLDEMAMRLCGRAPAERAWPFEQTVVPLERHTSPASVRGPKAMDGRDEGQLDRPHDKQLR